ncbi:MAG TPA: hypothetical protein VEX37_06535 [Thermomicrobiales bacterium]|nr:hypothetical protein [Thermomicrobiales bacterium]
MTGFRNTLTFAAVVLLLVAVVAACGGSDDDDGGVVPVMSTFTPVPPDYTPEAAQTRAAHETAFSETQTAQPDVTATPPSGSPVEGTPRATLAPGEVRPPDAILRTPSGDTFGVIGSWNFYYADTDTGAKVDAPYVPLPGDAVNWPNGTTAQIEVPNSPYAVRSAAIDFYTYDDNVALPQTTDGVPTGEIAFFPQTPPSQQAQIPGPTVSVAVDLPPGDYLVSSRIDWDAPATTEGELFTQYVYVIRVD